VAYIVGEAWVPIEGSFACLFFHNFVITHSSINMHENSSRDTSNQPAPADKAQRDTFKQNVQKVGIVQTKNGEHIVVCDYVYLMLWKYVKFVTNESELDFEGLIAQTVMREVNVANDDTI
jgi:hypothetical protein